MYDLYPLYPRYNDDYKTGQNTATSDWQNYNHDLLVHSAMTILAHEEECLIPPTVLGWAKQILKLGSKPDEPKEIPVESHGMCPFRQWIDKKLSAYYCNLKSDYCESTNDILGLQLGDSCPLTEQGVLVKRG